MAKISPKEIDDLVATLKKGKEGDYTLDSTDFDAILKAVGDKGAVDEINKKLGRTSTYEDTRQALANVMASAKNYPNYQDRLERKMKRGELTESLASGLGVARDLFQVGVASGQISRSNKALGQLIRPSTPAAPGVDPALNNELTNAQRGTFNAARQIQPAEQAINSGYAGDLANARQIAGGQQGVYGVLAQQASLNRNRSLSGLAPMIDNARSREQSRVDSLLQARQQQRQQGFNNQMDLYNVANQNYNQNVQTASQLGQAGRENLYGGIGNLSDSLAVLGGGLQMPAWAQRQRSQQGGVEPTPEYSGVPEMKQFQSTIDQHSAYRNPAYINSLMTGTPYYGGNAQTRY